MQRLHELGARRILVTGTGPIGCVPGELASQGSRNGECAAGPTQAANLYNPQLTQMLRELNSQVGSNAFIASNTGRMLNDFVNNPRAYGKFYSFFLFLFLPPCGKNRNLIS